MSSSVHVDVPLEEMPINQLGKQEENVGQDSQIVLLLTYVLVKGEIDCPEEGFVHKTTYFLEVVKEMSHCLFVLAQPYNLS